jgi:hypothetical protein
MTRCAILLLAALVTGCATDCGNRDWQERGYRDGFGGHPTQIESLRRQCAQQGVTVSEAEYLKGWASGHDEWDRLIGSRQNSQR